MKLEILTVYWGERNASLYLNGLKPSIIPQLSDDMVWNIFSDSEPDIKWKNTHWRSTDNLRDRNDKLHAALIWQIKECLKNGSKMLIAPPDTIFGVSSIKNLLQLAHEPKTCIAVAHPRVLPTILYELVNLVPTNENLVSMAFRHLHKSWSEAEVGLIGQNSFIGGVSWQKISENLISVCHRLPTPYLCDFTEGDLKFFDNQPGFGDYDHTWASMLLQQNRLKFVGSSDLAFVCEITDADKNVPPVQLGADPNQFWKKNPHNDLCGSFRVTFRGK